VDVHVLTGMTPQDLERLPLLRRGVELDPEEQAAPA
jgi:hypothetical protein